MQSTINLGGWQHWL